MSALDEKVYDKERDLREHIEKSHMKLVDSYVKTGKILGESQLDSCAMTNEPRESPGCNSEDHDTLNDEKDVTGFDMSIEEDVSFVEVPDEDVTILDTTDEDVAFLNTETTQDDPDLQKIADDYWPRVILTRI